MERLLELKLSVHILSVVQSASRRLYEMIFSMQKVQFYCKSGITKKECRMGAAELLVSIPDDNNCNMRLSCCIKH